MTTPAVTLKPLISPNLTRAALVAGAAIQAGAFYAPESWRHYCWALGALAWMLAGYGSKVPAWMVGRPLLPVALLPIALGAQSLAETALPSVLPHLPPVAQSVAGVVLGVLGLLVGKVMPQPVEVHSEAAESGEVVALATCSLEDAARGLCKPV